MEVHTWPRLDLLRPPDDSAFIIGAVRSKLKIACSQEFYPQVEFNPPNYPLLLSRLILSPVVNAHPNFIPFFIPFIVFIRLKHAVE